MRSQHDGCPEGGHLFEEPVQQLTVLCVQARVGFVEQP
jgi:hypothetical protein